MCTMDNNATMTAFKDSLISMSMNMGTIISIYPLAPVEDQANLIVLMTINMILMDG